MKSNIQTPNVNYDLKPTKEQRGFLRRRTQGFMDGFGITTRPLSHILQEVYLQGMRDALDVLTPKDTSHDVA